MKAEGSAQSPDALHVRENCIQTTGGVGLLELITPKVRQSRPSNLFSSIGFCSQNWRTHARCTEHAVVSFAPPTLIRVYADRRNNAPGLIKPSVDMVKPSLVYPTLTILTVTQRRATPCLRGLRPPLETSSARRNTQQLTRGLPLPPSKARTPRSTALDAPTSWLKNRQPQPEFSVTKRKQRYQRSSHRHGYHLSNVVITATSILQVDWLLSKPLRSSEKFAINAQPVRDSSRLSLHSRSPKCERPIIGSGKTAVYLLSCY